MSTERARVEESKVPFMVLPFYGIHSHCNYYFVIVVVGAVAHGFFPIQWFFHAYFVSHRISREHKGNDGCVVRQKPRNCVRASCFSGFGAETVLVQCLEVHVWTIHTHNGSIMNVVAALRAPHINYITYFIYYYCSLSNDPLARFFSFRERSLACVQANESQPAEM